MFSSPGFYLHVYDFHLVATEGMRLPGYKGFALRGAFGNMLKKTVCVTRGQKCGDCLLASRCIYTLLFESSSPRNHPEDTKYLEYPRPYIIIPPGDTERTIREGDPFSFRLTLVGNSNDYLPYILYTFQQIGERGLRRNGGRYFIESVASVDRDGRSTEIYRARLAPSLATPIGFADLDRDVPDTGSLTLHFETPTRIKENDRLMDGPPPFSTLIHLLAERVSNLSYHCGVENSCPSAEELLGGRTLPEVTGSSLRWQDHIHNSSRQKTTMKLGGFTGTVRYSGELRDYVPLLRLGEYVHVGSITTSGFGKYRIAYE